MSLKAIMAVAVSSLVLAASGVHAQTGDPTGIWQTQAGDARVRVSRCGSGLCGVIVSLREKIDPATGQPFTDTKNPNPQLARRPMVGLPLFSEMRPTGDASWAGRIYNADDGSTYASKVSLAGPDSLRVEGCLGAICGGETWTRSGR